MARILETVKTYEPTADGGMTHSGYFIISDNYRMKWASVRDWASLTARPSALRLNVDRLLQRLADAS